MTKKPEKLQVDEIIGHNIVIERKSRYIAREELADMMNLTSSHIGLIERGERGATAVNLSKLARIFGIPIDNLFASSNNHGMSVYAGQGDATEARRKKIQSLVTCLADAELDFVIHSIKGIIAMSTQQGE